MKERMEGIFNSLFPGGRFKRELKNLQKKARENPGKLQLLVRMADLLFKAGKTEEAVDTYRLAAEGYARDGLVNEAIAVKKILLRLDPSRTEIHRELNDLYGRKGINWDEKGQGKREPELKIPERRVHQRYPVQCPVSFFWMKKEFSALATDLGLGGMGVRSFLVLPPKEEIVFQLSIKKNSIWPKGRIVQNRSLPQVGNLSHVEFVHMSDTARDMLKTFLSGLPA